MNRLIEFCIETDILDNIPFDFSRELIDSIGYQKWLDKDCAISYELYKSQGNYDIPSYPKQRMKQLVPVGCVQFVTTWLKEVYNIDYKPIQIPHSLFTAKYTNRECFFADNPTNNFELTEEFKNKNGNKLFVKDVSILKSDICGVYTEKEIRNLNLGKRTFYSEIVDFESEYRIFVYKNKIVGLNHYCGDFWLFPDKDILEEMVKEYTPYAPIAYTLDVGIHKCCMPMEKMGKYVTSIIEVHDFFSVGLYGFNDSRLLPFMFYRWWNEYITKNK